MNSQPDEAGFDSENLSDDSKEEVKEAARANKRRAMRKALMAISPLKSATKRLKDSDDLVDQKLNKLLNDVYKEQV